MKKLLTKTLLVAVCLLVGGVKSAWGDVNTTLIDDITLPSLPTGTYTGGTDVTHSGSNKAVVADNDGNSVMQASSPGYGSPTGDFSWTNAYDGSKDGAWSTTGTTWAAPDGSIFVGSTAYTTSENAHYVNFARRGNLRNNRTFAYRFTNCGGVSALVKSQGKTDAAAACLAVYEVGTGSSLTPVETVTSKTNAVDILTVDELSSSKTYVAYIYGMNGSNGELYEVAFLKPSDDAPKLSASPSSVTLTATESGVAVNGSFTITGSNLTDGTYDLNIPSVTGLTVSPTSFTVTDGAVSQVVSLSYSSTENVDANSINITATVGELNLSVAVNYSASVIAWELQTISTAKTWDFSKLTGGKQYTTDEDKNTEHVYANISEIGYSDNSFDKTALAFTGEYPLREGKKFAQNGTFRFNTSVPGYIRVTFSDTGTSASATAIKRYLVVNGETTEYWVSREKTGDGAYAAQLNVTTDPIVVPAGDVTITGTGAHTYSKLEFKPVTSVSGTITPAGWSTFASSYPLDLSTLNATSSATAYYASAADGNIVTLTSTTATVPAGEGLMIKGTAGETFTIGVAAGGTAINGNLLKAGDGTEVAASTAGAYHYVFGYKKPDDVVTEYGFYNLADPTIVPAGKAYLETALVAGARSLSIVFDDETTGIENFTPALPEGEGAVYNLRGQRVAQPTKGLYIVNGKKVIIK